MAGQGEGSHESQPLLAASDSVREFQTRASRFYAGFLDFVFSDNVLQVAVGLILATAFTSVVKSFVSDVLLPIISLLPFIGKQLEEKFAVLRSGPNAAGGYNTLKQAIDDGALVLAYGSFLDKLVNLLGIGLTLYSIALIYGWAAHDNIIHPTTRCKFCKKYISIKAQRCVNCTSWQDGRDSG
ncbi:hypothetical protein HWV62_399 [Athelia sp. TMB]|nr:hypothetical protein HWV62_399 [Athelia sp. TMB]